MSLARGLSGYWPMEGNANDASGNGNDGTVTGAQLAAGGGKFGQCYNFDGVDDYINFGNDTSLDITNSITLEAWIYMDAPTVTYMGVLGKYDTATDHQRYLLSVTLISGIWRIDLILRDIGYRVTSQLTLDAGVWYHIAGTGTVGDYMRVWRNGIPDTEATFLPYPFGTTDRPGLIGAYWQGYPTLTVNKFKGKIDGARIWNRELSAAEIRQSMLGFLHGGM